MVTRRSGERGARRGTIVVGTLLALAVLAAASVLLRQDVATSPSAVTPAVTFSAGQDYVAINAAGFATLTLGASSTSATLAVSGVPGAASITLSKLLNVTNQDASQAYTTTLTRSAAPNTAITGFTVTIKTTAGSTITSWNAATTSSSSSFTMPAATTYVVDVAMTIADGTAVGALGSFTIHVDLAV